MNPPHEQTARGGREAIELAVSDQTAGGSRETLNTPSAGRQALHTAALDVVEVVE